MSLSPVASLRPQSSASDAPFGLAGFGDITLGPTAPGGPAGLAQEPVEAAAPDQLVPAGPAAEDVVTRQAPDRVVAAQARDHVPAGGADEHVGAVGARLGRRQPTALDGGRRARRLGNRSCVVAWRR